jgi:hypothetical protein
VHCISNFGLCGALPEHSVAIQLLRLVFCLLVDAAFPLLNPLNIGHTLHKFLWEVNTILAYIKRPGLIA